MSYEISFVVPGNPIPMSRPRVSGGHAYTPKRCSLYVSQVAHLARLVTHAKPDAYAANDARWAVLVHFFRADSRRTDLDNLAKGILDGLTESGLWVDDSQVCELTLRKEVDRDNPRALVQAWVIR